MASCGFPPPSKYVVEGGCCELEETTLQSTGSDPEEPTKDEIDASVARS